MHFDYYIPTRIIFGRGRLSELSSLPLPGKKALIVITNGQSMRNFGYLDKVIRSLEAAGVETVLFDKVLPIRRRLMLWKPRIWPVMKIVIS